MNKTTHCFLEKIDESTKNTIIDSIARHYDISSNDAFLEITAPESEHLLDYLTGSVRDATSVLMQKHGFR